jgi:hypothetical protein
MQYVNMNTFELEKWVWTENDFENMGWHDATIYGIRLNQNLEMDLDYIFQWNQPEVEGFHFTFWIAPCTLAFESPKELSFELTQSFDDKWLEIEGVEMSIQDDEKHWTIITHQGEVAFKAGSFKQIVRKQPSLQLGQVVPYDERGGFTFDLIPGDTLNSEVRPEILLRRRKQFEDYELAKRRYQLTKELELLSEQRENGQLETKDYIIKKKELKERIDSLTFQLRGSRYD